MSFLASIHDVDMKAHFASFIINSLVAVLKLITKRLWLEGWTSPPHAMVASGSLLARVVHAERR